LPKCTHVFKRSLQTTATALTSVVTSTGCGVSAALVAGVVVAVMLSGESLSIFPSMCALWCVSGISCWGCCGRRAVARVFLSRFLLRCVCFTFLLCSFLFAPTSSVCSVHSSFCDPQPFFHSSILFSHCAFSPRLGTFPSTSHPSSMF
jgi:hypothetical protein